MAPEVVHSHTGYGFKADIWSFGITALELAHGRPPLSHLPPLKSLLMKITKRFHFSDYEINTSGSSKKGNKKFSKAFREMVGLCLEQDPTKRPSAEKLLKHPFFKNCKGLDFVVKNVLHSLSNAEQMFMESQILIKSVGDDDEEDQSKDKKEDDNVTITGYELGLGLSNEEAKNQEGEVVGFDKDLVLEKLKVLKKSLEHQRARVSIIIEALSGDKEEKSREEELLEMVEKLKIELETEKLKTLRADKDSVLG